MRPAELKMARQLIDTLAADWDPAKYTDEYKQNLMKIINARLKGKSVSPRSGRYGPEAGGSC